jgi:hypothetical protein
MNKSISQGLKLLLAGSATAVLVYLLLIKGPDVAPVFESVGAEILVTSIMFTLSVLLLAAGVMNIIDDIKARRKKKPQTF